MKLLLLGENQAVEFGTKILADDVGNQVCAFLNSGGGYIICGADNQGNIFGVSTEEDIAELEVNLSRDISPKTLISIETQELNEKKLIVIEVPAGKDIPYAFRDNVFVREDDEVVRASIETIRDMVMRREVEPERWERRFSSAELEADLDTNEINSAIRATEISSRIQFRNVNNIVAALEDLGVSKYGRLTNGGDVLFCKNPSTRYPQLRVRAACFTEDRTDDTYRDMQFYEGPLVSLLEQVYGFIQRNTSTTAHFRKDNLSRQDKPLYPNEAVREGLVNAFSHRDYSDFSGGIAVHIYPNRLEIWNSGSLPHGVTLDSLTIGHISILRNPDIAHVLYLRGLMEKLGRGSVMIQKACEERGLPKPVWHSEEGYGVTLTFFTPEVTTEATTEATTEVTPEVTPQVTSQVTPQVAPQVPPQVTPEVMRILVVIQGSMSSRELREKLGLKNQKYFRTAYLQPALEEQYIEMTVPDKPTSSKQKYRLTDLGQSAIKH